MAAAGHAGAGHDAGQDARKPITRSAALDRLAAAASGPLEHIPGPAVGYVCSYVPEEIILAAGLHPLRLGARPGPTGPADSCLQSFACSFARALLDGLLTGRETGLAGVVFAYTCDSLRAAFEAWKVHAPPGFFVHFLNLPARVEGPGVEAYTASEMRRLAGVLATVPGSRPVTAESLAEATEVTRSLRRNLDRLARVRSARSDLLPGSTYLAVARATSRMERREAAALLAALAGELEPATRATVGADSGAGAASRARRPRVLVSGGFLETEQPLRLIEEAGADTVSDDLCLAGRRLAFPPDADGAGPVSDQDSDPSAGPDYTLGSGGDPLARLALSYLKRIPCPTKHPPVARFERIMDQAAVDEVDGVVFLLQKFCDPHAFDYPGLRDSLAAAGLPSLLVEVEQGGVPAGQARTRLEAFVERLRESGPRRPGVAVAERQSRRPGRTGRPAAGPTTGRCLRGGSR